MYIGWAHSVIPKCFAFSAFVINPVFIYIILKDTKLQLGQYKFLLLYFSIFNISCSLCDLMVPVCIFDYRYAFSIFVVDGYFETPSDLGRYLLGFRCSYITGTYAILHSHFSYRYMTLTHDRLLNDYFLPYGLFLTVVYCLCHMLFWTFVAGYLSSGYHVERRMYLRDSMLGYYKIDTLNMNIIIAQYDEADSEFIRDSWIGIGILSVVSLSSLSLLATLGWRTVKELGKQSMFMSATTKRQQKQLIQALVVQTLVPTIASFSPCAFSWFQPVWGINGGRWLQHASGIAMSTFPSMDPLAIIIILPSFRRLLTEMLRTKLLPKRDSIQVNVVNNAFAIDSQMCLPSRCYSYQTTRNSAICQIPLTAEHIMMISSAEFLIPKLTGIASFLINPLFIFIIMKDTKLQLGNYRYLLLYFTIFNMTCSLCDLLIPTGIHDHRYAFSIFIADGFFQENSQLNQYLLMLRCSFIAATYAILHSHFLYRFYILFNQKLLVKHFLPTGLCLVIVYCIGMMCYWMTFCHLLIDEDHEVRLYIRQSLMDVYGKDSMKVPILTSLFSEGSPDLIRKSYISIIGMSALSAYAVIVYFVLGIIIIRKLNSQTLIMSKKTKQLQKQLMNALVVQSMIPTVVSFSPCFISWYQAMFCIDLGRWLLEASVVAISAFPFLDPLALIIYVPTFRNRFKDIFGCKKKPTPPQGRF